MRHTVFFPDGRRADRSKYYPTKTRARIMCEVATIIEAKTRARVQTRAQLDLWRAEGLITENDISELDLSPDKIKITLDDSFTQWAATWYVSEGESVNRWIRIRGICEIIGPDRSIGDITYADGERLKLELRRQGKKTATIRKYIQDFKRTLRHQVLMGVLDHNPIAELSAGRIPAHEKPDQVALTASEVQMCLDNARARIQAGEIGWKVLHGDLEFFLLFAFGTGCRRKELLGIRWDFIDWDRRSITVPAELAKDKEAREIGIGGRLYDELKNRRELDGFIFRRWYPTTVTKAVGIHFEKCGIKARLHDCRHTYTTLIQTSAGARPDQAMQRTGHNDLKMLSHYTHARFTEVIEDRLPFMEPAEIEAPPGPTKH